jgi:uncharacterized protein with HEPN domain
MSDFSLMRSCRRLFCHHLTVIGEAINRLSPELRGRHPGVPWQQIVVAVRHRIVHANFDLDWQILWNAATDDIPQPREQVCRILESEFPDPRSG